ncbi:MAG: DUF4846 domain-containing protein, partial [Lachnospiraceae bacterium]|nr:DUF4846 domain-containing protein [Lachnospiraceae bacterium]
MGKKGYGKYVAAALVFCALAGTAGLLLSCSGKDNTVPAPENQEASGLQSDAGAEQREITPERQEPKHEDNEDTNEPDEPVQYTIIRPEGSTLETRIAVPEGYSRSKVKEGSLGSFLRSYPMKKDGKPVLLYDGSKKGNQSAHAAVFKLPIEPEDLQQCADSVMRVYAEYFWKTGQIDRIKFHFVDGFLADYARWRDGGRIQVGNNGSGWVQSASYDDSYSNFKKYMRIVFAYAGTLSMEKESEKISLGKLRIGDIFIKGDSPGHVVMVVDVCKDSEGKKAFLLGQGYMPAQEFHLLNNPRREGNPWYYEEDVSYPFETPEYTF